MATVYSEPPMEVTTPAPSVASVKAWPPASVMTVRAFPPTAVRPRSEIVEQELSTRLKLTLYDGLHVAEDRAGTGGDIADCSRGISAPRC